jgi:hypothetical protein
MLENAIQGRREEGPIARAIEEQTSRVPSDVFLWAALGAIGVSVTLQTMNKRERSLFFGQWVPTLLLLGLYNKIVKVAGSDRHDAEMDQPHFATP